MKPPFRLAEARASSDTIQAVEELLRQARSSRLIGIAFVAMYQQREFRLSAIGEAKRSPTFTRGMIAALDDYMGKLVNKS